MVISAIIAQINISMVCDLLVELSFSLVARDRPQYRPPASHQKGNVESRNFARNNIVLALLT